MRTTFAGAVLLLAAIVAPAGRTDEPTLAEEAAFRAAVDRVAGAVVRLEPVASSATGGGGGEGVPGAGPSSGLVVDADADAGKSWIVTSSFAVPDDLDQIVVVRPDGTRGVGRVVGRDRTRAVVLLETARIEAAPRLAVTPRSELEPGQWAIAVGRGWNQPAPGVSVGIVSATDRCWGRAVQTDAAVSPANYGGPLVDIAGRVIGLLAPLPADTAGMQQGTELYDAGIGFAVPLEDVLRVLPRLRQGDTLVPGILGITWQGTDLINGPPVIGSCRSGSPAARAGLRAGDRIAGIAGREIRRIADARHQLVPRYAGDEIDLTIDRAATSGREKIAVRVTLGDRLPPWKRATLGVLPAAPAHADEQAERGVEVAGVLAGGPAERAGIRVGDRIASVRTAAATGDDAAVPVATAADLVGVLAGVEPAATVAIGYVRDGKHATAMVVAAEASTDPAAVLAALGDRAAGADVGGLPAGAADAATVIKLELPDDRQRPVAVVPTARAAGPLPLLVYCGPPRGPLDEAAAAAWKAAVARSGVAVLLPGSLDPQRWWPADIAAIGRGVLALETRRPIDRQRIAIAGAKAGGAFAWLVAERFGPQARGVAVIDAGLPRQATIEPVDPLHWKWVLFGGGEGT
ncbi:MAG: trypsin-like peptidase domain-containing protein, partial [Planctomycetia bacterium]